MMSREEMSALTRRYLGMAGDVEGLLQRTKIKKEAREAALDLQVSASVIKQRAEMMSTGTEEDLQESLKQTPTAKRLAALATELEEKKKELAEKEQELAKHKAVQEQVLAALEIFKSIPTQTSDEKRLTLVNSYTFPESSNKLAAAFCNKKLTHIQTMSMGKLADTLTGSEKLVGSVASIKKRLARSKLRLDRAESKEDSATVTQEVAHQQALQLELQDLLLQEVRARILDEQHKNSMLTYGKALEQVVPDKTAREVFQALSYADHEIQKQVDAAKDVGGELVAAANLFDEDNPYTQQSQDELEKKSTELAATIAATETEVDTAKAKQQKQSAENKLLTEVKGREDKAISESYKLKKRLSAALSSYSPSGAVNLDWAQKVCQDVERDLTNGRMDYLLAEGGESALEQVNYALGELEAFNEQIAELHRKANSPMFELHDYSSPQGNKTWGVNSERFTRSKATDIATVGPDGALTIRFVVPHFHKRDWLLTNNAKKILGRYHDFLKSQGYKITKQPDGNYIAARQDGKKTDIKAAAKLVHAFEEQENSQGDRYKCQFSNLNKALERYEAHQKRLKGEPKDNATASGVAVKDPSQPVAAKTASYVPMADNEKFSEISPGQTPEPSAPDAAG